MKKKGHPTGGRRHLWVQPLTVYLKISAVTSIFLGTENAVVNNTKRPVLRHLCYWGAGGRVETGSKQSSK